jgi:hypothetical protein
VQSCYAAVVLELLRNPGRDRPPTPKEVANDLRKLYGTRGVFAGTKREGLFCTFIVALCDQDDTFAANYLDGEQAEREWWQRDHVLTGFGLSAQEPESHWQALACARRGELEHYALCVWFDRGSWPDFQKRYRIFRRAPRLAPRYRPAGPELSIREITHLLQS